MNHHTKSPPSQILSSSLLAMAALLLLSACGPKLLAKEEAQKLLDSTKLLAGKCRIEIRQGRLVPDEGVGFWLEAAMPKDGSPLLTECAAGIEKLGIAKLDSPCTVSTGSSGLTKQICSLTAENTMKKQDYKVVQSFDCATATGKVTSVATEGNVATVKYVKEVQVKPDISSAKLPERCATVELPESNQERTFTAQRDDEGHWSVKSGL